MAVHEDEDRVMFDVPDEIQEEEAKVMFCGDI